MSFKEDSRGTKRKEGMVIKRPNWSDKHKHYPKCVYAYLPIITYDGYIVWLEHCYKYVYLRPDPHGGTEYKFARDYHTAKQLQFREIGDI